MSTTNTRGVAAASEVRIVCLLVQNKDAVRVSEDLYMHDVQSEFQ
jgi:hypothetical protein